MWCVGAVVCCCVPVGTPWCGRPPASLLPPPNSSASHIHFSLYRRTGTQPTMGTVFGVNTNGERRTALRLPFPVSIGNSAFAKPPLVSNSKADRWSDPRAPGPHTFARTRFHSVAKQLSTVLSSPRPGQRCPFDWTRCSENGMGSGTISDWERKSKLSNDTKGAIRKRYGELSLPPPPGGTRCFPLSGSLRARGGGPRGRGPAPCTAGGSAGWW